MCPRFARALCCALVVWAQAATAFAQSAPRKPAARPAAPAAAAPAASAPLDDRRAQALLAEAQGALQRGDFPAAEQAGTQLLEENTRLFGADHPNVAVAVNLLGYVALRQGRFGEAEARFRRMLAITEQRLGPTHEFTASALNGLALVLERQGDYPGAETLLRRAHGILEKTLGAQHPDTATTLSNLGRVLDTQGKFAATGAQPQPGAPRSGATRPCRWSSAPRKPCSAGSMPKPRRCTSESSRRMKRRWARSTRPPPPRFPIWATCFSCRASTLRPRRFTAARW